MTTDSSLKVEEKASGFVQSWVQEKLPSMGFDIAPRLKGGLRAHSLGPSKRACEIGPAGSDESPHCRGGSCGTIEKSGYARHVLQQGLGGALNAPDHDTAEGGVRLRWRLSI